MTSTASQSLRTLGNSDLQLPPIGFGAWAIGGGNWEFAWGPQNDDESIAAIHRALESLVSLSHDEIRSARADKFLAIGRSL